MWKAKLKVTDVPSLRSNLKKIPTKDGPEPEADHCCEYYRGMLGECKQLLEAAELPHTYLPSHLFDNMKNIETMDCDNLYEYVKELSDHSRYIQQHEPIDLSVEGLRRSHPDVVKELRNYWLFIRTINRVREHWEQCMNEALEVDPDYKYHRPNDFTDFSYFDTEVF